MSGAQNSKPDPPAPRVVSYGMWGFGIAVCAAGVLMVSIWLATETASHNLHDVGLLCLFLGGLIQFVGGFIGVYVDPQNTWWRRFARFLGLLGMGVMTLWFVLYLISLALALSSGHVLPKHQL